MVTKACKPRIKPHAGRGRFRFGWLSKPANHESSPMPAGVDFAPDGHQSLQTTNQTLCRPASISLRMVIKPSKPQVKPHAGRGRFHFGWSSKPANHESSPMPAGVGSAPDGHETQQTTNQAPPRPASISLRMVIKACKSRIKPHPGRCQLRSGW